MKASRCAVVIGVLLVAVGLCSAQDTSRVSVDSSGTEGNDESGRFDPTPTSADGMIVAFTSRASNLVSGDTNGAYDIFVHDRSTGVTERVSVDSSGVEGNGDSMDPSISADGQVVAFMSDASNFCPSDRFGHDVFIHDRSTGVTELVSVDSSGVQGDLASWSPALSSDGRYVAFISDARNLVSGDTNYDTDVFVHDRVTGATKRVSVDSSGNQGNDRSGTYDTVAISGNGQFVAFSSLATNLVALDTNGRVDVFVRDRAAGSTERVSVSTNGAEGNGISLYPAISNDGQFVAFTSVATNLVSQDTNGHGDVFLRDRGVATTVRVSLDSSGGEGNADSGQYDPASISADRRFVVFTSGASNLVANDTNFADDIFVRDMIAGTTERLSVDSSGVQSTDLSMSPTIAADGIVVAFNSFASNLVSRDKNGHCDAFVHERCSMPASWQNYGVGLPGTNGVPGFSARSNPMLGSALSLDVTNSYGIATTGLLFVGLQQASLHSALGGDLLVVPLFTNFIAIPSTGLTLVGNLPGDPALCGTPVDLQAWEADPGAAKGVSFTPGLELVLGH